MVAPVRRSIAETVSSVVDATQSRLPHSDSEHLARLDVRDDRAAP